jgi:hypothetical protein
MNRYEVRSNGIMSPTVHIWDALVHRRVQTFKDHNDAQETCDLYNRAHGGNLEQLSLPL